MSSPSSAALMKWAQAASRGFAAAAASGSGRKVAVLGAAGGIGQPLSVLMKARARKQGRTLDASPLGGLIEYFA